LRFYASQFELVEVDSSYYAMPGGSNATLWAERTPPGFTFDVKAFRLFTGHQTPRESFPKDMQAALPETGKAHLYYRDVPPDILDELWRRYFEALEPLRAASKLGAILFQFAPWLTTAPADVAHVEHCAARAHGYLTAFEFRNRTWLDERNRDSTLAMERKHGVVHVVMDAPEGVSNRPHTVWETTSPALAIVRLHGRNAQTWNIKGATAASDRFNYDYPDAELGELAALIVELARRVALTHVVFNNNYEDQGQRNARKLIAIFAGMAAGDIATRGT
jgi:uncharacterized protein YecE (DUF72 family)